LSRAESAAYIGISPTKFDELIRGGRMPRPKRIDGRTVWDRKALDEAFDNLPEDVEPNPWDMTTALNEKD
jgi:predicted DNA-binding transcriptional regulator AlpA